MRRLHLSTGLAIGSLVVVSAVVFSATEGAEALTSASGTVYHDANQNGRRDAGEAGIADIVVQSGSKVTMTDKNGKWSMNVRTGRYIELRTGWYRTQCNAPTCARGPGRDQDFAARYQNLRVKARSTVARYDAGLVPDWPRGYPMPVRSKRTKNASDVSLRISFVAPTGKAGGSNCYRTSQELHRACAIGDRPEFRVQIYNEGTEPIVNPAGHLQLPPGTRLASLTAATGNHPRLGLVAVGRSDPSIGTIPFTITGTLPPAGVGMYELTLVVEPDAPITTQLQTKGTYPNAVGARMTSDDDDGDLCGPGLVCAWGVTDRQIFPDNSDTVGFAIVANDGGSDHDDTGATPSRIGDATTTTMPVVTLPPTTTTTTTTPPTTSTIPVVTLPPTTTTTTTTTTTSTTTAPAPTSTAPCTVSDLLVPSCGAWLGASIPSRDGSYTWSAGLAEYESVAQNVPDILHFYKTGAKKFPTATERSLAERAGEQRSLLLYNWKPSGLTWREVADGRADDQVATVAAGLKAYPHKVFLNIYHEPEDNVDTTASSGMTVADYQAMYRHVVDELRSHGVNNAVYVWNPMGYEGWRDYLDGLYPGDDYVDWMCYDPYAKDDMRKNLADIANRPRPNLGWPGYYDWATSKAPGKPLMMCEFGVDTISNSDPAAILGGDAEQLMRDFPMLKAFVYWNSVDSHVDTRIDNTSAKGRAYGDAYRQFANQPFFNAMSPDVAP